MFVGGLRPTSVPLSLSKKDKSKGNMVRRVSSLLSSNFEDEVLNFYGTCFEFELYGVSVLGNDLFYTKLPFGVSAVYAEFDY